MLFLFFCSSYSSAFTHFLFQPFVGDGTKSARRIHRSQWRLIRESSKACSPTADRQLTFNTKCSKIVVVVVVVLCCLCTMRRR